MNKKGFLFVVTVFLILTYILLSISVWVKGVEASERAYAEFYKESNVELAIEQITPAKIDNVTNVMMNRALFRLNQHSIENPVELGAEDENKNIRDAMFELLVNGSADARYFTGSAAIEPEQSSLSAWASNLNASLLAIGIYVSDFQVSNFTLNQTDINRFNYSFDLTLQLRDKSNTASVSRTYSVNNSVLINGLVDPALARASRDKAGDEHIAYRQFFFNEDEFNEPGSIEIEKLESGEGGQGWFYGYLASASGPLDHVPDAASVDVADRRNYLLVGDFSEIMALTPEIYEDFGGYILTDGPGYPSSCGTHQNQNNTFKPLFYSGPTCDVVTVTGGRDVRTASPFLVAPHFDATDAPDCPVLTDNSTGRCALIVAAYLPNEVDADPARKMVSADTGVYGIEKMRGFVMCGYYTHNPNAPSYLQRLLPDSYSRNSTEFGIETFVIGQYSNSTSYHDNSRLDRELFNDTITGIKIRGLPGCRTYESCSDSPSTGIFRVGSDALGEYGLDDIACSTGAGCD